MGLIVDGPAIARDLGVDPALLRQWVRRRHIARHGVDALGRVLLDYDEVHDEAARRGLIGRMDAG